MPWPLSKIGEKLCSRSGIRELMDDLGQVMAGSRNALMLGGGNPAAIPAVQAVWRARMEALLADGKAFDRMLGNYDTPQGRPALIDAVVSYFRRRFGWKLHAENVAITNGSQSALFFLFNMLAGDFADGTHRRVLLPLSPEYIGYADQGLVPDMFTSNRPAIELVDERTFKYHVDFDRVTVDDSVAAIAVSRPTNPTGNVISDAELVRLGELARAHDIPLIVDSAYGSPFPKILFTDVKPIRDENTILAFSLSKIGLPGTRTGIVIAPPEIVRAIAGMNSIAALASGNVGPELIASLLESGELEALCDREITPFYEVKAHSAESWFYDALPPGLPVYLHKCEGALFLWIWCRDLPISSFELYERLRDRGVVVVSGHYFFYGLDTPWRHEQECLRVNYSQPAEIVRPGLQAIAEEIARAYDGD